MVSGHSLSSATYCYLWIADVVTRTVYYKYFHPKEALISNGVVNRYVGSSVSSKVECTFQWFYVNSINLALILLLTAASPTPTPPPHGQGSGNYGLGLTRCCLVSWEQLYRFFSHGANLLKFPLYNEYYYPTHALLCGKAIDHGASEMYEMPAWTASLIYLVLQAKVVFLLQRNQ